MSRTGSAIDREALREKYRRERDKRLRPDGIRQYRRLEGQFAHYRRDPYTPVSQREPKTDHVRFAFVGGGFAGLVTGARLVEAGIEDVRVIDEGGDFGGTWYWNRFPGAQCDTASYVYMPLLEETGYMPRDKYASAPEIREHARRIGRQFGLYDNALFHTKVQSLRWLAQPGVWRIGTNRGDNFTAKYIGVGIGSLNVPKLPGIPGVETFRGHSFHTSRWDYEYTGGDPGGAPMDKLAGKRVAILGTGATAVQCIPYLARACSQLYVCQRTPSSVDARNNRRTDPEWFRQIATPGWQKRWTENFVANQSIEEAEVDLVQDGWTEMARRIREKICALSVADRHDPEKRLAAYEEADFERMEEIRARIDQIVDDPDTAQRLKPWYYQLCKRPCFHDDYLKAFNQPSTTLLDTDGRGVDRIFDRGVVVRGAAYEVDCIIFSTGFEVGTPWWDRAGFDLEGRDGLTLSQYWSDKLHTLHGIHVHGFPNAFFAEPSPHGGNLVSNFTHNLNAAGAAIAAVVRHAEDRGARMVEVTKEAEDAWRKQVRSGSRGMLGALDCTPGFYNYEGRLQARGHRQGRGYPGGQLAYFRYLDAWCSSGRFDGLSFTD